MPRKPQWPGRRSAPGLTPAPARVVPATSGPEPAGPTAGTELTSLLGPVRAGNAFEDHGFAGVIGGGHRRMVGLGPRIERVRAGVKNSG